MQAYKWIYYTYCSYLKQFFVLAFLIHNPYLVTSFISISQCCMKNIYRWLFVLLLTILSGCSLTKTPDSTESPAIGFDSTISDLSTSLSTETVSFEQISSMARVQDWWYRGDYYRVSTHAFNSNISGSQLDTLISDMNRSDLWYQSEQLQQSKDVVIRSVSTCYLDSLDNQITWNSSTSWLMYHVRQWWSWWYDMVDGETISLWDQQTLAFTIKNTTSDLIQFSGSNNCGPITPYGYARWYIARPVINDLDIFYDYHNQTGTLIAQSQSYFRDIDNQNFAKQWFMTQALPLWAIVRISPMTTWVVSIVSWSFQVNNTGTITNLAFENSATLFNTMLFGTGNYDIILYDKRWGIYDIDLIVYDTIKLSPKKIDSSLDEQWYYRGYHTQSPAIIIDQDTSNKLLARQYSGLQIARDVRFDDCYTPDCFAFDIKIQSGQSIKTVTVVDQFGITWSVDLVFTMSAIKSSLQSASVRWVWINLLTQWVWDNAIQVDYHNIDSSTLYYYPCEWKPDADIAKQLDRAWYSDWYGSKYARLEDLLFSCDPKSYNQPFTSQTKKYRDPRTINLAVPTQLSASKAFAVKTPYTKSNASQLFIQTQIGIYVKQWEQSATIWLFDLHTGKPITWSVQLQLYQLDSQKWRSSSWSQTISTWPHRVATTSRWEMTAFTAKLGTDRWFVTLWGKNNQTELRTRDRSVSLQSSIRIWEVSESAYIQSRWFNPTSRIYGYTDRWLYKPGDQLFVAWWDRKLSDIGASRSSVSWLVTVSVRLASDWSVIMLQNTGVRLDNYGWFHTSFDIPVDAKVADYMIEFVDPDGATYTQTIKINEYQKPSFFINQQWWRSGDQYQVSISPQYYFGSPVQWWNYQTDRSLAWQSRWRRWREQMGDESDYYYDTRLEYTDSTTSLAGTIAGWGSNAAVTSKLFTRSDLPSNSLTLKVTTSLTDTLSNETHVASDYNTIEPQVSIWLAGGPYDWYYAATISKLKPISYTTSGELDTVASTTYTWYYFDWKTQSMSKWVDGSLYYNGQYYTTVSSGTLSKKSWTISVASIQKPGDRLLVVQARDRNGKEIWHNEKSIWYADGDGYNYGSLNNNYTLTVSIDQKQYDEGQQIPININPYINGATVLITVEQWDRIVDSYLKTLDGWPISIPAKAAYYPSAMISVTQIAGYNLVNQASSKVRKEPRMRQWYSQVKINQNLFKLNIAITTDKEQYKPGEQVTLTIKTTDYRWKPVDARLSVGIVDKSLNDLYSYFKSPLSDFFLSLGTTIINYTNMKWLYQWLKVFTQEGSKWWGWWWRNPLWFLRQKFEDVAYWRWWVYSKDGVWMTTLTLPDNLTTRTIDVMGITQDTKVGTTTQDIIATKDLIVQPNLPLYLTLGDRIQMPVKVLGITDKINKLNKQDVSITTTIKTIDNQLILTHTSSIKLNSSTIVPLYIDPKRYQYTEIVVYTEAKIGDYVDAAREIIPLRTNWLTQQTLKTSLSRQWSLTHPLLSWALNPQLSITLGQIPLVSLGNQLDYMISYPYGCAEQTASTIAALLTAQRLSKQWLLTQYVSGDMITPTYQSSFSLTQAVSDSRTRLWAYQSSNGGFTYRWDTETRYTLSVYIYSIIMTYPQLYQWYEGKLTLLERFLDTNGWANNPEQYLYYLYQKSIHRWWVNLTQVQQIINKDLTARVAPVLLWAAIASNMWDLEMARAWFTKLDIDDFDGQQSEYGQLYPLVTPRSALLIYQSLINKLEPSKSAQLHNELLVSLLRQRNTQWTWWYSTVDNLAALTMIGEYQSHRAGATISCTLTQWGKTQTITLTSWQSYQQQFDNINPDANLLERSCNGDIIIDSKVTSVITSFDPLLLTKHNVEYLQRAIPTKLEIGQISNAIAQFKITQSAPHVAIELYVPSTYKLSDIINAKNSNSYDLPFTVDGWYSCKPDHYEVRFDRLFLYYNNLEANQSCRITIPILKAYSGSTITVPSKLYQMYDDSVYATSEPTMK